MYKLSMKLLIVLFLLIAGTAQAQTEYVPPSDEQLWSWWLSIPMEEKIELIRNYDIIEHTEPDIDLPVMTAILTNETDLFIVPLEGVPATIKIHNLSYEFDMSTWLIEDFYEPDNNIDDFILTGVLSFIAGALIWEVIR